jgi:predicted pyridoxine 5'-phosphate oxidase superfamily flavin-nucleotide-binding protein
MKGSVDERKRSPAGESASRLVDVGEVRLAWGNPASWKARWRDESLQRHLSRPLGERLRSALSLVLRRSDREGRTT